MCFSAWLLIFPTFASAFTLLTKDLTGWKKLELVFYFNPANCSRPAGELEASLREALALWNRVPTADIHLKYGGRTDNTGSQSDPVMECNTGDLGPVLGAGTITTSGGEITSGKLELNSDSSSTADIATLEDAKVPIMIAHEVGHVLGLGHTTHSNALMYYSLANKSALYLNPDDGDGLAFLYPRHEPIDGVMGCGSLSLPPDGGSGGLLWLAVMGALTLLWRQCRRPLSILGKTS